MTSDIATADHGADLGRLLADSRATYDELARLQTRVAALRTVDDARLAYDALLDEEMRAIADLRRDRDALLVEQRRRRLTLAHSDVVIAAPPPRVERRPQAAVRSDVGSAPEQPVRPQTTDRRKLKKLVSRWQFTWSLDQAVVAQVNSIADDADRPLGEALALLEWRLYETPIPGESSGDHIARVGEWRDVLAAYAQHLRADIDTAETRYRNVLAIWERWSNARASDDGRLEWDRFIEATRAQKRNERDNLRAEVIALRETLGV
jgi:hypothetical protein